jgi:hypothetical protein
VGVSDVVHDLIFQPLLYMGAAALQARNSIDYVDRQIEPVYLVLNGKAERSLDAALLLLASYVQVCMVGAAVG